MQEYLNAISMAVKLFPLVALVFTLPYMIVQYYRYGAVLVLRTVIVYSFILYLMCTALLTMLPIPATVSDAILQQQTPQFIPFNGLRQWFHTSGFQLSDPSTWMDAVFTRSAFYMLANVAMMVPLGIYLRYCFDFSFGKTLVITFGYSLILELIQLSGLFGVSPVAYRMFDVDDLIANTLGGILGYWACKPLLRILPSQQELSGIAYRKGMHVSPVRRVTAALVDWLLLGGLLAAALVLFPPFRESLLDTGWKWRFAAAGALYIFAVLLYFILGEWLCRGRTAGKRITHLRCVDAQSGARPRLWQLAVKYAFLYLGYPSIPVIASLLLLVIVKKYLLASRLFTAGFILMALYGVVILLVVIRVLRRHGQLPHAVLSKLRVISTLQGAPERCKPPK